MAKKIVTQKLDACAQAAWNLFQKGIHGPKVEEIATEAHSGSLWPVNEEEFSWVRKHLRQIKEILEAEHDYTVILVNHLYYIRFKRRMPKTVEVAKDVLPKRGQFQARGLHFVTEPADTILAALGGKIWDGSVLGGANTVKRYVQREVTQNRLKASDGAQYLKTLKDEI
jgi:hypothetical protein